MTKIFRDVALLKPQRKPCYHLARNSPPKPPVLLHKGSEGVLGLVWQAAGNSVYTQYAVGTFHTGADVNRASGCSKRPSSKAAASEEARRYIPHFVWAVRPCNGSWRTDKHPLVLPTSESLILYVEPLSDARTPLADFLSILIAEDFKRPTPCKIEACDACEPVVITSERRT